MNKAKTNTEARRLNKIISLLRERNRITKRQLAQMNECSGKTIQRDMRKLEANGWPIESDQHGYFLAKGGQHDLNTSKNQQIAALVLAGCSIDKYLAEYIPNLAETIRNFFHKTSDINTLSYSPTSLTIHAERCSMTEEQLDNFGALARYIINEETVTFLYRAVGKPYAIERHVFPISLKQVDRVWYLIGHDQLYHGLRCFTFAKITDIALCDKNYPIPEDATINAGLRYGDFSIWDSGSEDQEKYEIEVELRGSSADFVLTHKIHHSQETISQDDGTVILKLTTSDLTGVNLWLRKFVQEVRILKPKLLRDQYLSALKAGVRLCSDSQ